MENEIKEKIKNQVNQFTEKLIDEEPCREISEIKGERYEYIST